LCAVIRVLEYGSKEENSGRTKEANKSSIDQKASIITDSVVSVWKNFMEI